jgi:hypothetical protein
MDWVKVDRTRWVYLPSLTLEDKIALGLDEAVIEDLKKIPEAEKKSPVKEQKKDKQKES